MNNIRLVDKTTLRLITEYLNDIQPKDSTSQVYVDGNRTLYHNNGVRAYILTDFGEGVFQIPQDILKRLQRQYKLKKLNV